MRSMPVIAWQLITVPSLKMVMVRLSLPLSCRSRPDGHRDRSGPVLAGPGQPHLARFAHSRAPPCLQ
jgi:hypothetical protein